MTQATLEQIVEQIDAIAEQGQEHLGAYLDAHARRLAEEGRFKLLAFAYFRAGRVRQSHAYLNKVAREELDDGERRLAATIRHQSRLERRMRFGLYLPSDKRWWRRIVDGALNLVRYGRLRNPTSSVPRDLRAVGAQVRAAREHDVRALSALLEQHEEDFTARGHAKFLAFNFYHAGCLERAAQHARQVDSATLSPTETAFLANILFENEALERMRRGEPPVAVGAPWHGAPCEDRPRALYLAASSRPFIQSGYTSRGEALVGALRQCDGFSLLPVTRPGFPHDRGDAKDLSRVDEPDLPFASIATEAAFRGDLETYLARALPILETYARDRGATLVHGVSNYRNAVIGLALARRMGIPFVYEIRGLWEETADTKLAGWRETERFEFERGFERWLAHTADGVLTINAQVRDVLGLEASDHVRLLPNCVARDAIVDRGERPARRGLTIGYIGSILEYEGLDDLVEAVARVQANGHEVRIDIYGRGADQQRLRDLVRDLGVADVTLHGAVDPETVPSLYAGFDLCVFPRKPYRVCQLVTPLKPLEAMANDVNVIVSDVAPMAAFAADGSVLSVAAGDVGALARSIEEFIACPADARRALREKARALLRRSYVWEAQCGTVKGVYHAALRRRDEAVARPAGEPTGAPA